MTVAWRAEDLVSQDEKARRRAESILAHPDIAALVVSFETALRQAGPIYDDSPVRKVAGELVATAFVLGLESALTTERQAAQGAKDE